MSCATFIFDVRQFLCDACATRFEDKYPGKRLLYEGTFDEYNAPFFCARCIGKLKQVCHGVDCAFEAWWENQ